MKLGDDVNLFGRIWQTVDIEKAGRHLKECFSKNAVYYFQRDDLEETFLSGDEFDAVGGQLVV